MGVSFDGPWTAMFLTAATATVGSGLAGIVRGYNTGQNGPMDAGLDNALLFGPIAASGAFGAWTGYKIGNYRTQFETTMSSVAYSAGTSAVCMAAGFGIGYIVSKLT